MLTIVIRSQRDALLESLVDIFSRYFCRCIAVRLHPPCCREIDLENSPEIVCYVERYSMHALSNLSGQGPILSLHRGSRQVRWFSPPGARCSFHGKKGGDWGLQGLVAAASGLSYGHSYGHICTYGYTHTYSYSYS